MITSKGRAWLHGAVVALTIGTAVSIIAQQPVVFSSPQAVTQSGSWTQTVTQGTGSNLHVVVDTAPTTAVTGTFFQATQPVSATSLPLPTGAATESTLGNVLTQSDFDTKTGSLTEAAPATDTASSGLNGRLQRIAQRITSLITALGSPFQAGGSIGNTSFGTTNFPTTVDTNSGNKSASTIRVVLATDQPALTNKLLVTPDSVALPANQSVNVAQINGVTPLMGAGATGTGAQRVNDVASSATGAAPPASALYVGGLGSGATGGFLTGVTVADTTKTVSITSATTTLMITGVSSRQVHISAIHLVTAVANNVALIEGTGATCGTGTAGMAGGTTAANGWNFAANGGLAMGSGYGDVIKTTTAGDSVCIITSAAGPLAGTIEYAIY